MNQTLQSEFHMNLADYYKWPVSRAVQLDREIDAKN